MRQFVKVVMVSIFLAVLSLSTANAQPVDANSKRIARFGSWYVMQKQVPSFDLGTGKSGKSIACSAFFKASNASLEFQAWSPDAWKVFIASEKWNYNSKKGKLTIQSGATKIPMFPAHYAGDMISASSVNVEASPQISMGPLRSLIAQKQPIVFYDNRNRKLITFPNSNSDLSKALERAIRCFVGGN